jgi:hypothetical protein
MITDEMVNAAYAVFCNPASHINVDGTFGPKPAMRAALEAVATMLRGIPDGYTMNDPQERRSPHEVGDEVCLDGHPHSSMNMMDVAMDAAAQIKGPACLLLQNCVVYEDRLHPKVESILNARITPIRALLFVAPESMGNLVVEPIKRCVEEALYTALSGYTERYKEYILRLESASFVRECNAERAKRSILPLMPETPQKPI